MVLYHSMNAGSLVGILRGSGDTQTLPCAKELVFALRGGGTEKLWASALAPDHKHLRHLSRCHCGIFTTFN